MAEPRRVQLSSVQSSSPFHPSAPKKPRQENQEPEAPAATTFRISLSLFKPDRRKCPEFFYPELVKNLQGNSKKNPSGEDKKHFSPFDDEEAERREVESLAKKFEEKYNKKRKDRMQDLIDMGYGYDDSDSFIDNSEAYDELVPASLTTKYGGFYINCGTLQFRQASDSEEEFVKEKKKKSPKKMKERGDKIKKKKREEEKKGKKTKHPKPWFTALNGTKKTKTPIGLQGMLARFKQEKEAEKKKAMDTSPSMTPKAVPTSSAAPGLPPPPPREAEPAPDPLLSTIVSETELLQAASAIDALSEKDLDNLLDLPPEKGVGSSVTAPAEGFKKPPSMPDGLPTSLEVKIKELTLAVRASEGDKKTILFTGKMNNSLLDIYLLSRDLSPALRSAVFTHLSSVLPCSKDTLVKWASRLYLHKQQGGRLQEPLRKLKEAVLKAMPEQINKYNKELKIYSEAKAKMQADDKEQKAHSEEEEEEDKGSKKTSGPRKKFQWTEEIRQLLGQLVRIKMDMFEPEGSGGMLSLEEYFKSFLDTEVKPIWPRGWMQARTLFNESRRLYPQLSSIMAKNKPSAPSKVKVKESQIKAERALHSSSVEVQGTAISSTLPVKSSPLNPSVFPTGGSPVTTYNQDNSLDGDLIRNPPSLDTVSEHLNVLSSRPSTFDFSVSKSSGLEKPTEEKKKISPVVSVANSSHSLPRPTSYTDKPLLIQDKKQPVQVHSSKMMSEVHHKVQQQAHGQVKITQVPTQVTSPSLQPSVKLYHMNNQHVKGSFTPPSQSNSPRMTSPSPPQRPSTPQTKSPKPQTFTSPPSINHHKTVVSPNLLGKHPGSSSTMVPTSYRPAMPRLPVTPSNNSGNTIGLNNTVSVSQSPQALLRNPAAVAVKKPSHPSQKLTLMALQDSGKGTQGVAKLLTSSMIGIAGGNPGTPPNLNHQAKCSSSPGLITSSSPSLTVLTPSYKPNGGKIPAPTSLGLMPV
ncbi:ubinuclein-1 [Pyxicephalus adspersus]|uniref:Ubinuclein-1 n=1 Tax=Pyxicephalus adspersus TaxID=30357 RepID=A0AAV2ZXQ6_PYXAD|nr:TPA: hypothetical protein GDO54_015090 [Pyxicephalus adspersus]